jgi:nitrite reductase/ring-hydroxylating ferredoxin subunit
MVGDSEGWEEDRMNDGATQRLCALADIPDGASRGFTIARADGASLRVFAVRRGETVHAYLNRCPHRGTPLDWRPDDFLDREGRNIVCATHGAIFRVEDGVCIAGPCAGDQLTPLPLERRGDDLHAPADPEG